MTGLAVDRRRALRWFDGNSLYVPNPYAVCAGRSGMRDPMLDRWHGLQMKGALPGSWVPRPRSPVEARRCRWKPTSYSHLGGNKHHPALLGTMRFLFKKDGTTATDFTVDAADASTVGRYQGQPAFHSVGNDGEKIRGDKRDVSSSTRRTDGACCTVVLLDTTEFRTSRRRHRLCSVFVAMLGRDSAYDSRHSGRSSARTVRMAGSSVQRTRMRHRFRPRIDCAYATAWLRNSGVGRNC